MRIALLVVSILTLSCPKVLADTIFFKNGEELEGEILSQDEQFIKLKVGYGTMLVEKFKVLKIHVETEEEKEARLKELEEKRALAVTMGDEGKVEYEGKWIPREKRDQILAEKKLAAQTLKEAQDAERSAMELAKKKELELKEKELQRLAKTSQSQDEKPSNRFGDRQSDNKSDRQSDKKTRSQKNPSKPNDYRNNPGLRDRNLEDQDER